MPRIVWNLTWTLFLAASLTLTLHRPAPPNAGVAPTIRFEPNVGQTDPAARFVARGARFALFLGEEEATLALRNGEAPESIVRMRWSSAEPKPRIEGRDQLGSRSHYLVGSPEQRRKNVPHFRQVAYRDLYPGTDLVFYGAGGRLEYDFVVEPGADPDQIELLFETDKADQRASAIDDEGGLMLALASGELSSPPPFIYQLDDAGRRRQVSGKFESRDGGKIGFRLGAYDRSRTVVIDPFLDYSTFIGAGGSEFADAVAVDAGGYAYITGFTASGEFPIRNPFQGSRRGDKDAFVTKLNQDGTDILYSTYLGGRDDDRGLGIAVDDDGSAYIVGETRSDDFPRTVNAFQRLFGGGGRDAFITKLDAEGDDLVFSGFLGDSDEDWADDVALDATGSLYVVGGTKSSRFPVTSGAAQTGFGGDSDGFAAKFDPSGSRLIYSTFFGGEGNDAAKSVAIDAERNAFVVGFTRSNNFPVSSFAFQRQRVGREDAFIAKLNDTGTVRIYSTYLGGDEPDFANAVSVASDGAAFVVGSTRSEDLPIVVPSADPSYNGDGDGWFARFPSTFSTPSTISFLGGVSEDTANGVSVGKSGSAFIAGHTKSLDFPILPGAVQSRRGDEAGDGFLTQVSNTGTVLIDSTYLGGDAVDEAFDVALDKREAAFVVGRTRSNNFPTTIGAFQGSRRGSDEGFVAKIVRNFEATTVSGASFSQIDSAVSPESIASVFGRGFSTGMEAANSVPLPAELAGTRVTVLDSAGFLRTAGLFFVSPEQINIEVPPGAAVGPADVFVDHNGVETASGVVEIHLSAPGIFTANSSGSGAPAATVVTVFADGSRVEYDAFTDAPVGSREPAPIDLGEQGDETTLVLFVTGVRFAAEVRAEINGQVAPVLFAGEQSEFTGLDQVNVRLDRSLIGSGRVEVVLIADGRVSNAVLIEIE